MKQTKKNRQFDLQIISRKRRIKQNFDEAFKTQLVS